jgi:ribosomal protein L37E
MSTPESVSINQRQQYRPPCERCGTRTMLARIEPSGDHGHDLRTYECTACGHSEVTKVKSA